MILSTLSSVSEGTRALWSEAQSRAQSVSGSCVSFLLAARSMKLLVRQGFSTCALVLATLA
jgi:hypothetical protein